MEVIHIIQRSREYLTEEGLPSRGMLSSVIREHRAEAARYQRLMGVYRGEGGILERQRARGLPNNRLSHPFARYIVAVTSGYLVGEPVSYHMSAPSATLEALQALYQRLSESSENAELARQAAIYGKGVELIDLDGLELRFAAVRPESAFVVYADTYDCAPLFGVLYGPNMDETGRSVKSWSVRVLTDSVTADYVCASPEAVGEPESVSPHCFGCVPLIEYWNDDDERGDFERVLTLLEAYDKLESDRVNDKEQFVDKLLVLTGCTLETDERGREPWRQLREDKALQLPDSSARAEYLASPLNETEVEILRRALKEDIHKLSMVPDLSDENFAANASGVAMRYKLWGLEQLMGVKQRWFQEGLRARLKAALNYLTVYRGLPRLDPADVRIAFSRAMPQNALEAAEIAERAHKAGAASVEARVRMLHRGDEWTEADVEAEAARIRQENQLKGGEENAGEP